MAADCAVQQALRLDVYAGEPGFQRLREIWNPLLHRSAYDTLFMTWEFQSTWWKHHGEGDPFFLVGTEGGDPVGIAPLYVEDIDGRRTVRIVGGTEVADYLDFIVLPGYEEPFVEAVVDWLMSGAAPAWDVIEWVNVPEEGVLYHIFPRVAARKGLPVEPEQEDVCPIIPLPATWEEYLMMLNKHQRHEIRRKIRRIERNADVHWYIVDHGHDLDREVEQFIRLHELSRPDKDAFMTPKMKAFFRDLAHVMLDAGWLQLSFIVVNGDTAASMYCFDYGDSILVYNSGYAPQSYASLSPGIVLLSYCIRHAIELGKRHFDFMQGDEEYKYRFGGQDTRVYRMTVPRA